MLATKNGGITGAIAPSPSLTTADPVVTTTPIPPAPALTITTTPEPPLPPPPPAMDTRPTQDLGHGGTPVSRSPAFLGVSRTFTGDLGSVQLRRTARSGDGLAPPKNATERAAHATYEVVKDFPLGNPKSGTWSSPAASLKLMFAKGMPALRKATDAPAPTTARTSEPSTPAPTSAPEYSRPDYWLSLGRESMAKGESARKMGRMVNESTRGVASERGLASNSGANLGLRCNEFAGAMALHLASQQLDVPFEVVRMGTSTTDCHYFIVLNREGTTGELPADKTKWGEGAVILDPWGSKQSAFEKSRRPPMLTDLTQDWIVQPRDFGGRMFSVCRFEPEAPALPPLPTLATLSDALPTARPLSDEARSGLEALAKALGNKPLPKLDLSKKD